MQFSHIKELAESVAGAGESVKDAVVVVPPYFTQFERDTVTDALEIAGLKLVALINDGTAVALNYALSRTFKEEKEWHVIFDAGASSTRATVVSFQHVPSPEDSKPKNGKNNKNGGHTQVSVAGVGFDRTAGGTELDKRLRDLLATDFLTKTGKDARKDVKAMAKLWKEAMRVKAILSSNTESFTTVESLLGDTDYRSKVTRRQFEAACEDLKSKFAGPIVEAIAKAGLTLDDITSVILTGGHSRTPMVKAAVEAAVGEYVSFPTSFSLKYLSTKTTVFTEAKSPTPSTQTKPPYSAEPSTEPPSPANSAQRTSKYKTSPHTTSKSLTYQTSKTWTSSVTK